jgi:hypothetical protein
MEHIEKTRLQALWRVVYLDFRRELRILGLFAHCASGC